MLFTAPLDAGVGRLARIRVGGVMDPYLFEDLARRALEIFPRSRNSAEAQLRVPGGEVRIGLDVKHSSESGSTSYSTRVAASYANLDDFEFSCGSNTPLQRVFTFFGAQDVTVGHPEFDRMFVVRSNDPATVISLFADAALRELLMQAHEEQWLTVWSQPAENTGVSPIFGCKHEVVWACAGIEYDARRLAARARLVTHVLRRLCEIGVAKPDDRAG
jgi:hypothetical protein